MALDLLSSLRCGVLNINMKVNLSLIMLSTLDHLVMQKCLLIKAISLKSKEHVALRQPSIYLLSIKERTHTPLSIYLAKCSVNIKLISPLRISITQAVFSQVISLVIVLVYRGKSRQDGSKRVDEQSIKAWAISFTPMLHPLWWCTDGTLIFFFFFHILYFQFFKNRVFLMSVSIFKLSKNLTTFQQTERVLSHGVII